MDIKELFNKINRELLMKAVRKHIKENWEHWGDLEELNKSFHTIANFAKRGSDKFKKAIETQW